jgi:NYN domain
VGNPGPLLPPPPSRTIVYVDGFNLYYAIKSTGFKWLDLVALAKLLLPNNQIDLVRYFTARVGALPHDPQAPTRQQAYLRALATLWPRLEVHEGHFLSHAVRMPLAKPRPKGTRTVVVIKTEEKGSDVNLATMLLVDGFQNRYDAAAVISNDSDLTLPIRMVRQILHKPVLVFNPHAINPTGKPSKMLRQVASQYRPIRTGVLGASQFAPNLVDANGGFNKPATW